MQEVFLSKLDKMKKKNKLIVQQALNQSRNHNDDQSQGANTEVSGGEGLMENKLTEINIDRLSHQRSHQVIKKQYQTQQIMEKSQPSVSFQNLRGLDKDDQIKYLASIVTQLSSQVIQN